MKPTEEQIQKEIAALKELLPKIRPTSIFGSDNIAQLRAQIEVLENRLNTNDVYDYYDHAGIDEEIISSALDAVQWLDGDYEVETLSENWEPLVLDDVDAGDTV